MKRSESLSGISYAGMNMTNEEAEAAFRVTLAIPSWVIAVIDSEAARSGVSRTSIINTWLVEKVDSLDEHRLELEAKRRQLADRPGA